MVVVNLLDDNVGDTFGSVSATSDVHTSFRWSGEKPMPGYQQLPFVEGA